MKELIKSPDAVAKNIKSQVSEMPDEECLQTLRGDDKFASLIQAWALVEDAINKLQEIK